MNFGGQWTLEKLSCLSDYLNAYTTALKNQPFELHYVDAFAGVGYLGAKRSSQAEQTLRIADLLDTEDNMAQDYRKGSAVKALDIKNKFHHYHFVEKNLNRYCSLKTNVDGVAKQYEDVRYDVYNQDANDWISNWCGSVNWVKSRAVVFLDPFGMEVKWDTINCIASTGAIDLWVLIPHAIGVNRQLPGGRYPKDEVVQTLKAFLGSDDFLKRAYQPSAQQHLDFDNVNGEVVKIFNSEMMASYCLERLRTVFPPSGVLEKPLVLRNRQNAEMFLFCFAVANKNPAAQNLALKMARAIVGKHGSY